MTFLHFILVLSIFFYVWALVQMYAFGKEDGKEEGIKIGYAKGRKEVNNHIDCYMSGKDGKE